MWGKVQWIRWNQQYTTLYYTHLVTSLVSHMKMDQNLILKFKMSIVDSLWSRQMNKFFCFNFTVTYFKHLLCVTIYSFINCLKAKKNRKHVKRWAGKKHEQKLNETHKDQVVAVSYRKYVVWYVCSVFLFIRIFVFVFAFIHKPFYLLFSFLEL